MEIAYTGPRRRWHWVAIVPLGIVAAVALGGIFVAQNFPIRKQSGGGLSLDVPGGHISIRSDDKRDPGSLGVPMYPGAKRTKGKGGATFSWSSNDGMNERKIAVAGAELFTPDSFDKVVAFYRGELPNWLFITGMDGGTRIELNEGGLKRIIRIRSENGGTHIGVATVGEPGSN